MADNDRFVIHNSSVIQLERDGRLVRLKLSGNPDLYRMYLERNNNLLIELSGNNTLDLLETQTPDFIQIIRKEDTGECYVNYIGANFDPKNVTTKTPDYCNIYIQDGKLYIDIDIKPEKLYTTDNTTTSTQKFISLYTKSGKNYIDFIGNIVTETPESIVVRRDETNGNFVVNYSGTGGGGSGIGSITTDTPHWLDVINSTNSAKIDFGGDIKTNTPESIGVTKDDINGDFIVDFKGSSGGGITSITTGTPSWLDVKTTNNVTNIDYVGVQEVGKRFGVVIAGSNSTLKLGEYDFKLTGNEDEQAFISIITALGDGVTDVYISGTLIFNTGQLFTISQELPSLRIVGLGPESGFEFSANTCFNFIHNYNGIIIFENLYFYGAGSDTTKTLNNSGYSICFNSDTNNTANRGLYINNCRIFRFSQFLRINSSNSESSANLGSVVSITNSNFRTCKHCLDIMSAASVKIIGNTFECYRTNSGDLPDDDNNLPVNSILCVRTREVHKVTISENTFRGYNHSIGLYTETSYYSTNFMINNNIFQNYKISGIRSFLAQGGMVSNNTFIIDENLVTGNETAIMNFRRTTETGQFPDFMSVVINSNNISRGGTGVELGAGTNAIVTSNILLTTTPFIVEQYGSGDSIIIENNLPIG